MTLYMTLTIYDAHKYFPTYDNNITNEFFLHRSSLAEQGWAPTQLARCKP